MTRIAVVGGGITGLSAAFHLPRTLPVTLIERSPHLGGWLSSTPLAADSGLALEAGPRTLRPNSVAIKELINLLRLHASVLTVPRSHPAARARYIHAPPLTLLPHSLPSLFTSPRTPALRSLLPALLREPFRPANFPIKQEGSTSTSEEDDNEDESVHEFITRRFGAEFARVFLSAFVHGIYATDARALSVRAAFPFLYDAEKRGGGSVVRGFLWDALTPARKGKQGEEGGYDVGDVDELLKDAAMFTFRGGIETLSQALVADLEARPNVQLRTGVRVERITPREDGMQIDTSTGQSGTYSHVISALPLPILHTLVSPPPPSPSSPSTQKSYSGASLPHLSSSTNPSSTVLVINLVFPPSRGKLHPDGFGFLVPRPVEGYLTQPQADALPSSGEKEGEIDLSYALIGTIFDDAISPPTETKVKEEKKNDDDVDWERATRLTLMLGGPHPLPSALKGMFTSSPSSSPSSPESYSGTGTSGEQRVLKEGTHDRELERIIPPLLRHLGRVFSPSPSSVPSSSSTAAETENTHTLPDPLIIRAHLHVDCIPTYTPGHVSRMDELRRALGHLSSCPSSTPSSLPSSSANPDANADADPLAGVVKSKEWTEELKLQYLQEREEAQKEREGGPWKGRMHVIGAGVGGVSLGDCVRQGREAARAIGASARGVDTSPSSSS